MCQSLKAVFLIKKGHFCPYFDGAVQAFAQVAQSPLRKLFWILLTLNWVACVGTKKEGSLVLNSESWQVADGLVPTGKHIFVFDFARAKFQKWSPSGHSEWLSLASAMQPFQPSQAIWGPNGHFFLLDRIHKRLALYDTNAQFLSGFTLPSEIKERNLNRVDVFWTRDGQFSFVDKGEGKVWKYAELRSAGGSGDWQLRYSVRLPLGIHSCIWEPYSKNPVCLSQKSKTPLVFDEYFNLTQDTLGPIPELGIYPIPSSTGLDWDFVISDTLLYSTSLGRITEMDRKFP